MHCIAPFTTFRAGKRIKTNDSYNNNNNSETANVNDNNN